MKLIGIVVALALAGLPGCVMGQLEQMVALDRDLSTEEIERVKGLEPEVRGELKPIRVAGNMHGDDVGGGFRERWVFPVYADQNIVVAGKGPGGTFGIGAAQFKEVPSLFPYLSHYLGVRWGSGASFVGEAARLARRCSRFEVNPLFHVAHARTRDRTLGWEVGIGKGLLVIGNSPRSIEGGGLILYGLWFLGRRSELTALDAGF
jgi:hypothetical protein